MSSCNISLNERNNICPYKIRCLWQYSKLVKRHVKKRIRKNLVNFLRQTRFFFTFSYYFDKYRDKIVKIQRFYHFFLMNRIAALVKLWIHECKLIIQENQKMRKITPPDPEWISKQIEEGLSEVTLEDCILNISP